MKTFLLGFAYFLILTTPIPLGFTLWVCWEIFSTDYTLLSLSMGGFLQENLLVWLHILARLAARILPHEPGFGVLVTLGLSLLWVLAGLFVFVLLAGMILYLFIILFSLT